METSSENPSVSVAACESEATGLICIQDESEVLLHTLHVLASPLVFLNLSHITVKFEQISKKIP